jgi:hypothetical protein
VNINKELLKSEIQTQTGLLSSMKEDIMPETKQMAKLAFDVFLEENKDKFKTEEDKINYIANNPSKVLMSLIRTETAIYREKEEQVYKEFLNLYMSDYYKKDNRYTEMERLFDYLQNKYGTIEFEDIGKIFSEIYDVMNHVVFSAAQSRKSRVGHSLENHFENILRLLDIPYTPQLDIEDSIIDFALPNEELLDDVPNNCLFLASQTTLKDRFRLSLSKLSNKYSEVRKYIITASGMGLITKRDIQDLSDIKINAIKNKNFKLVVFKDVKESKFENENAVISYEDLINKEIKLFINYWKDYGWL